MPPKKRILTKKKIIKKVVKTRLKESFKPPPLKLMRVYKAKRAPLGKGLREPVPIALMRAAIQEALDRIKNGKPEGQKGYSLNEAVKFVGKRNVELHLKQPETLRKYNWCGPGTVIAKRSNKDGSPKEWSYPINILDAGAWVHDWAYHRHQDVPGRNRADKKLMAECIKQIKNPRYPSDIRNAIKVYFIMKYKVDHKV